MNHISFQRIVVVFVSLMAAQNLQADLCSTISSQSFDGLVSTSRFLDRGTLTEGEALLWEKYQRQVQDDQDRRKELLDKQIKYGDKVMKFSLEKRGSPGPNGYPLYIALHGVGLRPRL